MTWSITRWFARNNLSKQESEQLERWRLLLHWASQTDYYWEHSALFAEAALGDSAAALRRGIHTLAPVPLPSYLLEARRFRSGYSRTVAPQPALTLWESKARVALVRPWFRTAGPTQTFNMDEDLRQTARRLNRQEADVIAATPALLLRLGDTVLAPPARALIALVAPGIQPLRDYERDRLWRRFKVPVFQQLRGFQGELLASECEAQSALHAHPNVAHWETRDDRLLVTSLQNMRHPVLRLATNWRGAMETSWCGCGCLTPRIFLAAERALPRKGTERRPALVGQPFSRTAIAAR